MGATCAGAPLAYAMQRYGWQVFFNVLIGACVISFLLLLPMSNLPSYTQRMRESESTLTKLA